ncbi:MAG: response regulator transcription factor [Prevotellaceae bacterium]|jgi:DNA-binding NarL/FixJ family response regulator|nr:response regulator transcription factor [Prevotellaceae bacterium]
MITTETLKILIADPSDIVRAGITGILRRIVRKGVTFFEAATPEDLEKLLKNYNPDILIANPTYWGKAVVVNANSVRVKKIALIYAPVADEVLGDFDDRISIFDNYRTVISKIEQLLVTKSDSDASTLSEPISAREKEIITLVAKGLTNKEIADKLFLSLHTVITHRRNVARKLEVRSAAGLTVYAIVNKLISIEEIKN